MPLSLVMAPGTIWKGCCLGQQLCRMNALKESEHFHSYLIVVLLALFSFVMEQGTECFHNCQLKRDPILCFCLVRMPVWMYVESNSTHSSSILRFKSKLTVQMAIFSYLKWVPLRLSRDRPVTNV